MKEIVDRADRLEKDLSRYTDTGEEIRKYRQKVHEQWRYGTTKEERSAAARRAVFLKQFPQVRWLGELAKNPWVRAGGRTLAAAGFVISAAGYYVDGDDGLTAITKAGVETAFAIGGSAAGSAAGGACGKAAVVCSPVFAVGGGMLGGWLGQQANEYVDKTGILGFRPYDWTDSLLSWD